MTKKSLRAKADRIVGTWCRSLGYCEKCNSQIGLCWCHIITRSILKLRYEEKNNLCLCNSCHKHFHNKPLEFSDFVRKKKGVATYKWLIRESNKLKPLDIKFYLEVIQKYEGRERRCVWN